MNYQEENPGIAFSKVKIILLLSLYFRLIKVGGANQVALMIYSESSQYSKKSFQSFLDFGIENWCAIKCIDFLKDYFDVYNTTES